jgi:diguanylate cyclase (GGDEF)-like protein
MASRDPLTGLHNRRHFDEVLSRGVSEARRYGTPLSCLMIDLDDFKAINDRFGHPVGDRALILAAETIATQLRASDVAARFGGDEFVVLLPQTDCGQAEVLSRRIADTYAACLREKLPRVSGGLSIGVAGLSNTPGTTADLLLRAADRALYEAKQRGKNRVEISAIPA